MRRPPPRLNLRLHLVGDTSPMLVYVLQWARSTGSPARTQKESGLGRRAVRAYQWRAHHGEHALAFAQPIIGDSVLHVAFHYYLRSHAPILFPLPSCDLYPRGMPPRSSTWYALAGIPGAVGQWWKSVCIRHECDPSIRPSKELRAHPRVHQ